MQTRQWMTTHEWMVKPMPQREWAERKGLMVFIAETFTSLGTGLFLVSLFMGNWWGMVIGWLIVMFLKLPVHIIYLGKPERFFRIMPPFSNAWKTSWFARGIIFTILFSSFAFVQLVVGHPFIADLIGPAAVPIYTVFAIFAAIFAVATGVYGGFMMNYCKSVPFWNTGILPIVFILAGVADGFGLIMGISLAGGGGDITTAEAGSRIMLIVNIVIIIVYIISANYTSITSKISVRELISGMAAWAFWLGVIVLGIIVPLAISISSVFTESGVSAVILISALVCHTIGAFALKYCLLKVGIHRPLVQKAGAY
jgi:sulfite dehydrogenase (quinone) subunit SoeC